MKYILPIVIVILIAIVGFFVFSKQSKPIVQQNTPQASISPKQNGSISFSNPKKSAHYESNTPAHAATLAGVPINVVIDFNFDLASNSTINVVHEASKTDYTQANTVIDSNKLSMRRKIKQEAPDGIYTVTYKACWPDGSCHDGNFQFAIDRSQAQSFQDETAQNEVTIKLSQIQFVPRNVKIAKGTKVTWINDDTEDHYVNSDSHPAHTYYPAQNSKLLKNGDEFSLTFDTAGIYPYHCSAHTSMTANLLVE